MPLETFLERQSRRPLDQTAREALESWLAEHAPRSKFRVRWDWSAGGTILNVRTTLIRWEVHLGRNGPDALTVLADIPAFVGGMFGPEKRERARVQAEAVLDGLGF